MAKIRNSGARRAIVARQLRVNMRVVATEQRSICWRRCFLAVARQLTVNTRAVATQQRNNRASVRDGVSWQLLGNSL
jgi:hypothetical protein